MHRLFVVGMNRIAVAYYVQYWQRHLGHPAAKVSHVKSCLPLANNDHSSNIFRPLSLRMNTSEDGWTFTPSH